MTTASTHLVPASWPTVLQGMSTSISSDLQSLQKTHEALYNAIQLHHVHSENIGAAEIELDQLEAAMKVLILQSHELRNEISAIQGVVAGPRALEGWRHQAKTAKTLLEEQMKAIKALGELP
eukprot:PhF_6_TR863/c0_g1_i3/m.1301